MIDPDEVLKNPLTVAIPDEPSTLIALCSALGYRADETNFDAIVRFAMRLKKENKGEFGELCVYDSITRNSGKNSRPNLRNTRAYCAWEAETDKF